MKNYNFVTHDQLEQDKEIVEFCRKSLSYRKQLSGEEEHEVRSIQVISEVRIVIAFSSV